MVAEGLRQGGHDAVHVRDFDLQQADDAEVFLFAANEERVLVSADTDFGNLLALRQQTKPSVILFRRTSHRRPADQVSLILNTLANLADSLEQGCIAVLEETRVRVRSLPIGREEEETR